ncbi:hypothetical protein [Chitinophaga sp. Cy-1792]|uniref:hypothetical protein n=1 Tax=Chitinophaga sp. Cy-1792 TaxID=2608339 RepID=UPI00141E7D4D|nr:hypothetical protein [Chitinophaga sp. Cy-1792]NIG56528.1 hypothetical protein [Chitinophaga sp. Cy-1792]
MRYLLLLTCLLTQIMVKAQQLHPYNDYVHNFSLSIPEKWRYWKNLDSIHVLLLAQNPDAPKIHDNYNVTVVMDPGSNVDSSFAHLMYYTSINRLKVLDTGTYVVDGKRIRWYEDIHLGRSGIDTIVAFNFLLYNKDRAYLLTCATTPNRRKLVKPLFHSIAQTFKTGLPIPVEVLKIDLSGDTQWEKVAENGNELVSSYQLAPAGESLKNWTRLLNFTTIKSAAATDISAILSNMKAQAEKEYTAPAITILANDPNYGMIKIETNESSNEANLFFIRKGDAGIHMIGYMVHRPQFNPGEAEHWQELFMKGKLVIE